MRKRHRFTRVLAVAVLVLAAAVLTTEAVAASRGGAVVKLGQSGLGRIIVDSHGKTLYLGGATSAVRVVATARARVRGRRWSLTASQGRLRYGWRSWARRVVLMGGHR